MFDPNLSYSELAHNFSALYNWGALFIILFAFFYYMHKKEGVLRKNDRINASQCLLSVIILIPIIVLFAHYPIEWGTYADREGYFYVFTHMDQAIINDYIWFAIYAIISLFSKDQIVFFTTLSTLYVGLRCFACIQFSKENCLLIFLMIISSFLFFSYGHNTIRSGVASSFLLLGFSLVFKKRIGIILAIILMLFSLGTHKSMAIPIIAFIISLLYRNSKVFIFLWGFSVFLSYFLGNTLSDYFGEMFTENVGEQAGGYITNAETSQYKTGFRIDFILYSLAPILIGVYYIFRKSFKDKIYISLYNTYILTNIFFVLVIRASFVDRFGYLSWMLMPILLIYPLLKKRMFERQNIVIAFTLLLNELFTFIMYLK